jgi:hypothetical protein
MCRLTPDRAPIGVSETKASSATNETSEQRKKRARHWEIACRYAWNANQASKRRPVKVLAKVRMRELERLFAYRWGPTLPDDDAGRDDLFVAAHHVANISNDHIADWARLWAPWATAEYITALVDRVAQKPMRWAADTLAWRVRLTDVDRTLLKITTIGAIDCNKAARAKRRKRKGAAAHQARRRKQGAVARSEYRVRSISNQKPWEALRVSRSTWYRNGRLKPPGKSIEISETSPSTAEDRPMQSTDLSHQA